MDYEIKFNGIKFSSKHGMYPSEKETDQLFVIDLSLVSNLEEEFNDEINSVINYEEVFNEVKKIMDSNPVDLIETLAKKIIYSMERFSPKSVTVTIHKPQTRMSKYSDDISVSLRHSFE